MKLNGITNALTKNAGTIGAIAGFAFYDQNGLNNVWDSILQASRGNVHLPDIKVILEHFIAEKAPAVIGTYAAGYIAKALGLPVIGKYGGALENLAMGYAAGSLALVFLTQMTHSPQIGEAYNELKAKYGNGAASFMAQAPVAYSY